jgi:hypothetical protein
MRANSSLPSLLVVVLALLGSCSPPEAPSAVVIDPEPPAAAPAPEPSQAPNEELLRRLEQILASQSQAEPNEVPAGTASQQVAANARPPPRPVRTVLVFQCTDEVTFAVRSGGRGLEVYPPRYSNGYILLAQQPSDAGLYYTAPGAELRMNEDLATLQVGRDRYVDSVSNPAAAVWEEPSRRGTPAR